MGKSRLYRNGAHGNEEEENKKKMKKDQNIRPTERISNHRLNDETHQGDSFKSGLNPSTKGLTKNSTKRGPAVCNVIPAEKSKRLNPRNDVFISDQNIRPTERISNHRLNDETHQGDSFESGLNPSTKGLTKNSTKRGPAVCNVIPTEKSKRLKVTYNERGQLKKANG
ncbi:hypothetical protein IFM89_007030 [Coptis chinensis]|uniref:Uncharacterized protein n=1 Tax=Coptis chinensis TaxID=261450 RepID=A0A835IKD4_9MAGN|nr:hypothetical protein IFM89_007030 [Coptis chinensis]